MALTVAELVATLALDSKGWDTQLTKSVGTATKELEKVPAEGRKAGAKTGEQLAEGIEDGAKKAGDKAATALEDADPRMRKVAADIGDHAGEALTGTMSSATATVGDDLADHFKSNSAGLDERARTVGKDAGESVSDGVRTGASGLGSGLDSKFKEETSNLPAIGRGAGKEAGEGVGAGILDGMPDLSGGIGGILDDALGSLPAGVAGPAMAAGAAMGAALTAGFADAIANEAGADKLAAGLGVGVDTAERDRLASASADLYRDAWGESTAEVNTAIDAVYSTLSESRESEAALERLTAKGMAIADVFGTDIALATSNAGVLIKTKLAKDADEAFDLITKAATEVPAHLRDELGDATQEYSTFFGQLGFDGQEAFGMLVDAAEEGQYALDKTGDAVKELFLRAGSVDDVAAQGALENIGLKSEDIVARLQAGGEGARAATSDIAGALLAVEDPALRFSASVALMGAPVEDLGARYPEFLEQLRDGRTVMDDASGAADRLAEGYDNTSSSITVLRREIQGMFEDYANKKLDPVAWLVSDDDKSISEWATNVGTTIGGGIVDAAKMTIFGPLGLFGIDIPNPWGGGGDDDSTAGQGAGAGIAGAQADEANRAADGWRNFNEQVFAWTTGTGAATVTAEEFAGQITDLEDRVKPVGTSLDQAAVGAKAFRDAMSGNPFEGMLSSALNVDEALGQLRTTTNRLADDVNIGAIAFGTETPGGDTAAMLEEVMAAAAPLRERIATMFEMGGEDAARKTADGIQADLLRIFDQAGLTKQQIADLFEVMGLSDESIEVAFEVSGADMAMAQIQVIKDMIGADLDGDDTRRLRAYISAQMVEEDFTGARDLLLAFQQDMTDGSLDNPILLAINADPTLATGTVAATKAEIEAAPPADIPVGADTLLANTQWQAFKRQMESQGVKIPVSLEVQARHAQQIVDGGGYGAPYKIGTIELGRGVDLNGNGVIGRAVGGDVWSGQRFRVGEQGPEDVVFPGNGHVFTAAETAMFDATRLPNVPMPGGSGGGAGANLSRLESRLDAVVDAVAGIQTSPAIGNVDIHEATPTQTLAEIIAAAQAGRIMAGTS